MLRSHAKAVHLEKYRACFSAGLCGVMWAWNNREGHTGLWLLQFNHRIACVGRDLKDHPDLISCHRQGCWPLNQAVDQAAKGPIQTRLENLKGLSIHNLSVQPVLEPFHTDVVPSGLNLTFLYCNKEIMQWYLIKYGKEVKEARKRSGWVIFLIWHREKQRSVARRQM